MCRAILWSLQPCCRRRIALASSNATGGLPPLDRGTAVNWISLGCWPVFDGESAWVFPRTNLRMLEISDFSIVFLVFKRKIARACFDWVLLGNQTVICSCNNSESPLPRQVFARSTHCRNSPRTHAWRRQYKRRLSPLHSLLTLCCLRASVPGSLRTS